MKCKIIKIDDPSKFANHIPDGFKPMVRFKDFGTNPILLLSFPLDRRKVMHSHHIKQALTRLPEADYEIVAIGGGFTLESIDLLKNAGAKVYSENDHFWTDSSHEKIKISIGTKVKKPNT